MNRSAGTDSNGAASAGGDADETGWAEPEPRPYDGPVPAWAMRRTLMRVLGFGLVVAAMIGLVVWLTMTLGSGVQPSFLQAWAVGPASIGAAVGAFLVLSSTGDLGGGRVSRDADEPGLYWVGVGRWPATRRTPIVGEPTASLVADEDEDEDDDDDEEQDGEDSIDETEDEDDDDDDDAVTLVLHDRERVAVAVVRTSVPDRGRAAFVLSVQGSIAGLAPGGSASVTRIVRAAGEASAQDVERQGRAFLQRMGLGEGETPTRRARLRGKFVRAEGSDAGAWLGWLFPVMGGFGGSTATGNSGSFWWFIGSAVVLTASAGLLVHIARAVLGIGRVVMRPMPDGGLRLRYMLGPIAIRSERVGPGFVVELEPYVLGDAFGTLVILRDGARSYTVAHLDEPELDGGDVCAVLDDRLRAMQPGDGGTTARRILDAFDLFAAQADQTRDDAEDDIADDGRRV